MKRAFTPATKREVLGYVADDHPHINRILHRTPLYIDLGEAVQGLESASPQRTSETGNLDRFNAVGSRVDAGGQRHLPVVEVDGGAKLQTERGSKAILEAVIERHYEGTGTYSPSSQLRDVLGDNGISLEVFDAPVRHMIGKRVTAVVLRTKEDGTFDVAGSMHGGQSHVYIQRAFSESDHATLIAELGNIGIVSPAWQQFAEQEGMGVVMAPWAAGN